MTDKKRKELLSLMKDGGIQVCEYARDCWISDKYKTDEKMRQQMIKEWGENISGVRELYKELRRSNG